MKKLRNIMFVRELMSRYHKHQSKIEFFRELMTSLLTTEHGVWWTCFVSICVLGFGTRQVGLDKPGGTVWDEVHFGGFMNHYINRTFYHDVHPPLGKLLIALTGWATGYNGTFSFHSGTVYENVDYGTIRAVMALFGGVLVPLTFLTVWELSFSITASTTAAIFVLCDTLIHRLNTLIILDPPLMAAIMTSIYFVVKFNNQRDREWSKQWWGYLLATGVSLGVVISIKYIGAFTVLVVGVHTVHQLLYILSDPHKRWWTVIPHTAARALCLIILPILVYLTSFFMHFIILTQWSPDGGAFYHTRFFTAFNNTEYDNSTFPQYIAYGDKLVLQNSRPMVGYLESWFDLYPRDITAPCQQVTSSTLRDFEALTWIMKKVDIEKGAVMDYSMPDNNNSSLPYISNGDYVMMHHYETGRSLRSHSYRAAVVKRHYQVCGYGENGVGGPAETWQLLIPGQPLGAPLEIFKGEFYLRHYRMNCFLKGNEDVPLPKEWAYNGAKEISCTRNVKETGLLWHVNWVNRTKQIGPTVSPKNYSMGFWEKLIYIHQAMIIGNSALKPTAEDLERSAKPWMWPLMYQLQTFASYEIDNSTDTRYVIGTHNPMVAYLNVLMLSAVVLLFIAHLYQKSRNPGEDEDITARRKSTLQTCGWLLLFWGIHYIPFWGMGRILYIHHYCPAFVYSCMISGVMVDYLAYCVSCNKKQIKGVDSRVIFVSTLISVLISSYIFVFPLATSIRGEPFEKEDSISKIFDLFDFGQPWCELGYNTHFITTYFKTKRLPFEKDILENPDLNATLYYHTILKKKTVQIGIPINPVSASNYTSWVSPVLHGEYNSTMWRFLEMKLNSTNATANIK